MQRLQLALLPGRKFAQPSRLQLPPKSMRAKCVPPQQRRLARNARLRLPHARLPGPRGRPHLAPLRGLT